MRNPHLWQSGCVRQGCCSFSAACDRGRPPGGPQRARPKSRAARRAALDELNQHLTLDELNQHLTNRQKALLTGGAVTGWISGSCRQKQNGQSQFPSLPKCPIPDVDWAAELRPKERASTSCKASSAADPSIPRPSSCW